MTIIMVNLVKGIHEYLLNKFIYAVKYDKIANSLYSWILLVRAGMSEGDLIIYKYSS